MSNLSSIVLLSGGLDSAANLAICADQGEAILAITCAYGQRAERNEIRAAARLAQYYGISQQVIDLRWLGALGGSSLTDSSQSVPKLQTQELDNLKITQDTAKSVWVPNRNGLMINVAAAFADKLKAQRVVVGFNREEATTFPDNSEAFLERSTQALSFSTANQVKLFSYTTQLDKREIVARLKSLSRPFPFDLVWSCYYGGETACGTCESCQRYARAVST